MTRRERIISAFNHQETDIAPYYMDFTALEYERLENAFGKGFDKDWQYHLQIYQYDGWPDNTSMPAHLFKDDFGVIWDRSGADKDIGVIHNHAIEDIECHKYVFPTIDANRLRREIEAFLSHKQDKFTVVGIGFSVFERAWSLCGMENVFVSMLANPEELTTLFTDIMNYNLSVMDIMLEYDFDSFYFGDDWGSQRGLMMGAESWRKFIKPVMQRLYAKAKQHGRFVIQHSCGDISDIFSDLIEIGLDCYQTFQPELYDIAKIKATYGKDLSFWGGVSTQQLLATATPAQVKSEAERILKTMKAGGGYIFAPSHTVAHDVPPENIIALYEVMKNQ